MATAPMNISMNRMDNYCDEKCAYSFNYQTSNICTATNYGSYIHLNYIDSGTQPPVKFNSNTYTVDNIEIYSPSLHNFNGQTVDGEIIITHFANNIGNPLIVCIPFVASGRPANEGTQIITDIINTTSSHPLKQGSPSINIKLNNYTLNSIVPTTSFFYYNNTNNYNIIVYGLDNAISVNPSVITSLQKMITPVSSVQYPNVEYLEFNKYGPSKEETTGDGQIYIDCQPTGNSTETEAVTYNKSPTTYDTGSIFQSPIFMYIVLALICVVILIIINKLLVYIFSS